MVEIKSDSKAKDIRKHRRLALFFSMPTLVFGLMIHLFQNCSPGFRVDLASQSSEQASISPNHPGAAIVLPTSQKGVIANRVYVNELLRDVFGPSAQTNAITAPWIYNQPALFGFPCNPARGDCPSPGLVPMNISGDTLRSGSKMQACLALTSNDVSMGYAIRRIEPSTVVMSPNNTNISRLYELFYRGDDAPEPLIDGLIQSDRETLRGSPDISVTDRWRLLTLAVCESSGWESL